MRNIAPSEFCFTDGGLANFRPTGPRPAPAGPSDAVQELSRRVDRLLASLPRAVAPKTAAPTPGQPDDDELDGAAIFAARQRDIEAARTRTGTPAPVDDDVFSLAGAAAVFAMRK